MIRVKRGDLLFRQTSHKLWFYHRYDEKIPLKIKVFNSLENAIKDSQKEKKPMAFGTEGLCLGCGKKFLVNLYNVKELCYKCEDLKAKKVREDHLQNLKRLSVDERLSIIEAWIYDESKVDRDTRLR